MSIRQYFSLVRGRSYYMTEFVNYFFSSRYMTDNILFKKYQYYQMAKSMNIADSTNVPASFNIEITNMCNLKCLHCFQSDKSNDNRKYGIMENGLFRKLVDDLEEMKYEGREIVLGAFGEALIDKNLLQKIQYIKSKLKTRIALLTNGMLLTEKNVDELLGANIDRINISLDAYEEETHWKVKNVSLEKIKGNIEYLLNKRVKTKTSVTISFVTNVLNYKERKLFFDYWENKVDGVYITYATSWAGTGKMKDVQYFKRARYLDTPCVFPWENFLVCHNGDVTACCLDYNADLVIGNIKNNTPVEIWKGEKLKKLRNAHLKRDLNDYPVCRRCDYATYW